MKFSALVERIAGESADAWVTHYAARRAQARGEDAILLSIGDPEVDSPTPVVERAIEALRAGETHYTPASGREELRQAIAALHRVRSGQAADPDQVVVLAGAQNALFAASLCLAGPGDEVIGIEPLYPTYPPTIEVTGAHLVRASSPPDKGFRVDLEGLAAAISPRTRAIFFATPNNPTGVIFSVAELAQIGDLARRHSLWIVADEVYAGLAAEGRVPSLAASLPEQVITIGSLSKTHAMTGWRAGWLVGPRTLAAHVEALAACMLFGLPRFIQSAAVTAIGIAGTAEAEMREYCRRRRDVLLAELEGVRGLRVSMPEAGMFLFADVRDTGLSGNEFMRALYDCERVSVLDGGAFGRETAGFVRISFATAEAQLREACARIRRFANSLPGQPRAQSRR